MIDANYADSPELGRWLEQRGDNIAVLTDYFFMEAYRRGNVTQGS